METTIKGHKMTKERAIIEYVLQWLNSNIDEPPKENLSEDSANLKQKIELALQKTITIKDIQGGTF